VLAHVRSHAGERVLCAFNVSDQPASLDLPVGMTIARSLDSSGATGARLFGAGQQVNFEPFGVFLARLV
jgi:alpha-glucosidase